LLKSYPSINHRQKNAEASESVDVGSKIPNPDCGQNDDESVQRSTAKTTLNLQRIQTPHPQNSEMKGSHTPRMGVGEHNISESPSSPCCDCTEA
jgi:hypothetical protein